MPSGFSGLPDQEAIEEIIIENDFFFPDLRLTSFITDYRISSEYQHDMMQRVIKMAFFYINADIKDQVENWLEAGFEQLDQVIMEGETEVDSAARVDRYIQAVYLRAKAALLIEYSSTNRRDQQVNQGKEDQALHDELFGQSQLLINNMKGYNGIHRFSLI